jgi:putative flippase GtrA
VSPPAVHTDLRRFLREAVGYTAASVCALLVDLGILWGLVHFLGWGYLAAATLSFVAGATVAYMLSVRLAFTHHRLRDRRAEFLSFVAIGSAGLLVNSGVMSIAVRYFGLHYLLAKCVAAGFTFICNFLARRRLLFIERPLV